MFAFAWRVGVRAGSAVTLAALLAGIPAGLATYIGWPLPDHMPSLAELRGFATTGVTDQVVLNVLAVVLWLVWLLIVFSVGVEAAAAVRGVQAPRLRLLGPVQSVAATLIAGLTFGVLAATAGPVSAGLLSPSAAQTAPVRPAAASLVLPASPAHPIVLTAAHTTTVAAPAGKVTLVIGDCGYEHKVVKGESLWRIAQLCLGDPHRWPEIYKLNKGRYWPHVSGHTTLHNPNLIFPGWVLELPHDAVPPPGGQPVTPPITPTPPAHATPSTSPTITPPASPVTPSPSITAVTPTATGPAVIAVPSVATSTSATPSGSPTMSHTPSASPDDPASGEQQPAGAGIHIPGGWIPALLGAALLTAAGRVWLRRRHRYTATPITTPVLDDADLTPPLAASTRIRQALRRAHPDDTDIPAEPIPAPTVREYNAAQVKPALPPVGPSGADLAGAATLPMSAGLGVTGPGAHDAARAMLVAVLSSGTLDDPDAQGRAIIPATTLATLLAVSAVELGPIPRLSIAASMAEAMTILEEEIIRRSRIIAEQEVADVAALRAANAYAEPLPQLLLIADTPDPHWQKRLATAIGLGETVDIGAVLLGDWPHGTTLSVASDGTTTGGSGGHRLAVLDTDAAAQALTMLHEAYADQPPTPPAGTVVSSAPTRSLADDLLDPEPIIDGAAHDQPTVSGADTAGRRVQVRVLGVPAVLDAAGQPVQKLRAKSIELLVYLAVNRAGAPLAQIMEALWPDATWRRASERLSTCVANLRHAIRGVLSDTFPDNTPDDKRVEPVLNSGGHYRLDPAVVDVDWWTVLDNYANVAHSDDAAARQAHLKTAIEAIGGPLAAGADYEWADTDREQVRRHQIKIYVHAAGLSADDDPHQSRVLYDIACEIDPISEDLAQRAMRAAAALGDADAIRHRLRLLRQALDSHGIDLQPATEQLAKDLLRELTRHHRTDT
jgi:two-component SAPR family response regulator